MVNQMKPSLNLKDLPKYDLETKVRDDKGNLISKGGVACPFPWRLHECLEAVEKEGLEHIVSWQSHGRSFTVYKPKQFAELIMPRFFGQTRYASFQRQLNIYGFSRFSQGQDKGAYYNLCFVRGHRDLVRDMKRIKVKGSKVRKAPSPDEDEFNFYDVAWQNHFEATVPAAVAQKPSTLSSMLMQQESNRPVSPASGPTSAAVDPSTFNLLMLLAANNQTVPMVPLAPCSIPNTAALEVPVPSPAGATVAPATTTKNYDANISTVSDDSSVGSVDSLSILDELMPELGLDDPLGAESSDLYAPIAVDFFQPTPIQDLVQMTLVDPTRNIYSL